MLNKLALCIMLLTATAFSQTFSVLYTFTDRPNGGNPFGGVVLDGAGNLYGTTDFGGANPCNVYGCGTVFKLDPSGKETVLFNFDGGTSGAGPTGNLIPDSQGNLYGMTGVGGQTCREGHGCGTVFKVDRAGHYTVLYTFAGGSDGARPYYTNLVRDPSGNFYGTTWEGGGTGCVGSGCGTVFKIDSAGNETIVHSFRTGVDGSAPFAGLIRDGAGNLYGTTSEGGVAFGFGTVFKIDAQNNYTVLYRFSGQADGSGPLGSVVRDSSGNLYGTTSFGGDLTCQPPSGCGVVFKLDTSGVETVLHAFHDSDGRAPNGNLIRDPSGNLYGVTQFGGQLGFGTVFKIDGSGNATVLHDFGNQTDGSYPHAGLVRDAAGNLYGTASYAGGGRCYLGEGCGVVFKIAP